MSNRITIKICQFCGKTYEAKKCDSMYCGQTCRKYACIERQRRRWGWRVPETYVSYKFKKQAESEKAEYDNALKLDFKTMAEETVKNIINSMLVNKP